MMSSNTDLVGSTDANAASPAVVGKAAIRCRSCDMPLRTTFVDLGLSPLCQTHIAEEQLQDSEPFYPLHAYVCEQCFLVQLPPLVTPQAIFTEYAYFSSYSTSWVEHARRYATAMTERFKLGGNSRVVELASNDGYLLQHFVERGIPVLGVEPAANVAQVAVEKGVPTRVAFFGNSSGVAADIAQEFGQADLLLGNNVLAHVPDLNDFVAGMKTLLAPTGVITMEFPHLLKLMAGNQFDTIYHEHFSYFSFIAVQKVFERHGLTLFDVEQLPTHGGSLRIYARHARNDALPIEPTVGALRRIEEQDGFTTLQRYTGFQEQVRKTKRALLTLLIDLNQAGKRVAGYGAPGKGNTLLNYCGIRTDLVSFTVDANPYKQGKYTPGTRIPIFAPSRIREARPDYVLILPWNLSDEIRGSAAYIREWGGKFIVPIPTAQVLD